MKTLQQCKEEIAKLYGFDNWDRIDFYMLDSQDQIAQRPYAEERLNDEVAELYASQFKPSNGYYSHQLDRIHELTNTVEKLQKFKEYVHDRLDKMGVPSNPEPENNAAHGCRIEGRLNIIESVFKEGVGQKEAFTLEDIRKAFAAGQNSQDWDEQHGWTTYYTFNKWIENHYK